MTEERFDFVDFQKKMAEFGIEEVVANDFIERTKKKIYFLTFTLDRKKNITSRINGYITFVDSKYPGKVEAGDVWICTAESTGEVYYAMPLYKVTPSFLMNLDNGLRTDMMDHFWKRNKAVFEKEFADKYKDEVHDQAIKEARADLEGIIAGLQERVASLQSQLDQSNMLLSQSNSVIEKSESKMIDLGSDICGDYIDLGSESVSDDAVVYSSENTDPPIIPSSYNSPAPGIPEIRVPEQRANVTKPLRYKVERTGKETIYSESFTSPKYFVHISPDANLLVIRPNDFGSALCLNKQISLKGLDGFAEYTGKKELMAEYSERYEGMIVYL